MAVIILGFIADGIIFVVTIFGVPMTVVPSTVVTLLAKIALINDEDVVPPAVAVDVTIDGSGIDDDTDTTCEVATPEPVTVPPPVELLTCRMVVRFCCTACI